MITILFVFDKEEKMGVRKIVPEL